MLKNQLTSIPKLRIIKTEWGAFGKRSAHRKIQEVSLKWVNGREVFTSRFCRWEKTEKGNRKRGTYRTFQKSSRRGYGSGENENETLPLAKGTKVALFGKGTIDYVKGGGGSGDVTVAYIRNFYEGMKIKEAEGEVSLFHELPEFYEKM